MTQRIAIVGECNSGKTTLVNTLLGGHILPTSFVTRTELPTEIEFGARSRLALEKLDRTRALISWANAAAVTPDGRRLRVRLPMPKLKRMRVVDTPALGAGDESSDRRIRSICRNADVVLWCTTALQAWKASEQHLWLSFSPRARERGILVVTFADMLRNSQDESRVIARLQGEAARYFQNIVVSSQLNDVLTQMASSLRGSESVACLAP